MCLGRMYGAVVGNDRGGVGAARSELASWGNEIVGRHECGQRLVEALASSSWWAKLCLGRHPPGRTPRPRSKHDPIQRHITCQRFPLLHRHVVLVRIKVINTSSLQRQGWYYDILINGLKSRLLIELDSVLISPLSDMCS